MNLPTNQTATTHLTPNSPEVYDIREKLCDLEDALVAATPNIATLLQPIHKQLKNDPEIVTVLSEQEVAVLVKGLKFQTSTEIVTAAKKAAPKKALKNTSVSDL